MTWEIFLAATLEYYNGVDEEVFYSVHILKPSLSYLLNNVDRGLEKEFELTVPPLY